MRKILLSVIVASLIPSLGYAAPVTGCDFDKDGREDTVNTRGCKANAQDVVYCKSIQITLSSGKESQKQTIDFTESKKRVKRAYTAFVCEDRDNNGGTALYATNKAGVENRIKQVRTKPAAGLDAVCNGVREMRSCEIWKSSASEHIPGSDPRANSTSFIALRGCPDSWSSCINGYDRDGNLVHKVGEYPNFISSYDSRHYGGTGCGDRKTPSSIAAQARKNTGSPEIYLKNTAGVCVRVPDASRCKNSSKC